MRYCRIQIVLTECIERGQSHRPRSSIRDSAAPAAFIFQVLKLFRKILPLQTVDDLVRSNIQSHIGPIVIVAADGHDHDNFPTGKIGNNPLQ